MSTAPFADGRKDSSGITTTYKTAELKDGNIWLAENFNYFLNHDVCQTFEGSRDTSERSRKNGVGLYYNWEAFAPNLGLAPTGWHVPTVNEWQAMMKCYGEIGSADTYNQLKVGGSSGLNLDSCGATYFPEDPCNQLAAQGFGYFWSASEGDDDRFAALIDLSDEEKKLDVKYLTKLFRVSVRLVKDK